MSKGSINFKINNQVEDYLKVMTYQLNKTPDEIINDAIINYYENKMNVNDEYSYSLSRLKKIIYEIDNYINAKESLYSIQSAKVKELNVMSSIKKDSSGIDDFITVKEKLTSLRKRLVREYKIIRAIVIKLNINVKLRSFNINNVSKETQEKYDNYYDSFKKLIEVKNEI